jgi:hypothetical protein
VRCSPFCFIPVISVIVVVVADVVAVFDVVVVVVIITIVVVFFTCIFLKNNTNIYSFSPLSADDQANDIACIDSNAFSNF